MGPLEISLLLHLDEADMEVLRQGQQVTMREMDPTRSQKGDLVEASDAAKPAMEEGTLGMAGGSQVMDELTLATPLTDQILEMRTDTPNFDRTIIALAEPIRSRSALTNHHTISLVWKRSFLVVNWRPPV